MMLCRSVFAAPAGWLILSADWSQAEVGVGQLPVLKGHMLLPPLKQPLAVHISVDIIETPAMHLV